MAHDVSHAVRTTHEGIWVHLDVEMWARAEPDVAGQADRLSGGDPIPWGNSNAGLLDVDVLYEVTGR